MTGITKKDNHISIFSRNSPVINIEVDIYSSDEEEYKIVRTRDNVVMGKIVVGQPSPVVKTEEKKGCGCSRAKKEHK